MERCSSSARLGTRGREKCLDLRHHFKASLPLGFSGTMPRKRKESELEVSEFWPDTG